VEDFIKKHSKHTSKKIEKISSDALSILMDYNWPGNTRELENAIERATILSKGTVIMPDDLPDSLRNLGTKKELPEGSKLKDALSLPEKDLIVKTLDSVGWNRNETARVLGINRTTLYKKMSKYGLLKNGKHHVEK
jgi:transcriptional regulator with PAS, ATPase and Fis domain